MNGSYTIAPFSSLCAASASGRPGGTLLGPNYLQRDRNALLKNEKGERLWAVMASHLTSWLTTGTDGHQYTLLISR